MMNFNRRRQLVLKAAAHADSLRIKFGIDKAANLDPILLSEQRGCEVRYLSLPSLEGIYSPIPKPVIILGSERPAGRRFFTCAHELGHHEFGHSMRIDELNHEKPFRAIDPDEFLADMFAATLLMPQLSIRHSLTIRNFNVNSLTPVQVFSLASFYGVGYSTLINHLTLTLGILNQKQRDYLIKITPKEIKAYFDCTPQSEVVLVDEFWKGRAVDLEIGDILVLHKKAVVDRNNCMSSSISVDGMPKYKAISRGYFRISHKHNDWGVNVRVAPKQYEGLARYRFLNDPEEDSI